MLLAQSRREPMSDETAADVVTRALRAVEQRAASNDVSDRGSQQLADAGRVTVAFHPDRLDRRGRTAAQGLLADAAYLSQWVTGVSSGSRSASHGGHRESWERELFDLPSDTPAAKRPVYGALDLLHHRHGGSPAFGSCFLVLRDHVRPRCTMSLGDSHLHPGRVGTFARPDAILAGLREQASRNELLGQPLTTEDLEAVLRGQRRPAPRRTLHDYVEVQVHGGVALPDVAAFVIDPSFMGTPVERQLRSAAEAADADFSSHAGTVIEPRALRHHPQAVDWDDDPAYVAELIEALEAVTAPAEPASAATIGRLLEGRRLPAPSPAGDEPRSLLQRVKHLWRLTYMLGRDARLSTEAAAGVVPPRLDH